MLPFEEKASHFCRPVERNSGPIGCYRFGEIGCWLKRPSSDVEILYPIDWYAFLRFAAILASTGTF
jgi:hypothetical protein